MTADETCWECGKKMIQRSIDYELYGIKIGSFPARVCDHCKEQFFSEETSRRITELVKKKGLWGLQARSRVGMAGKTLDIRLPKRIIDFTGIRKGTEVTITPEGKKRIVITV